MNPLILIIIYIASSLIGYNLIRRIPSLLHTPLMSATNAISGVTVLCALFAAGAAAATGSRALGFAAIILAMVNVAGGFGVTHRMLRMFVRKRDNTDD